MNNAIISYDGDSPVIAKEVSQKIADFEKEIKELKKKEEELKERIKEAMEENGVIKLENELLSVSYVAEYEKETLDTTKLKKELPEIYDGYVKMSKVKASVRIKAK
jgi:regulator of replication initiation timing